MPSLTHSKNPKSWKYFPPKLRARSRGSAQSWIAWPPSRGRQAAAGGTSGDGNVRTLPLSKSGDLPVSLTAQQGGLDPTKVTPSHTSLPLPIQIHLPALPGICTTPVHLLAAIMHCHLHCTAVHTYCTDLRHTCNTSAAGTLIPPVCNKDSGLNPE